MRCRFDRSRCDDAVLGHAEYGYAGSAGITASVTSAQHDPTLPNSSNVTVTITQNRRETGGGGGGRATSLLTLLLLGLLPRRLRSRRYAAVWMKTCCRA